MRVVLLATYAMRTRFELVLVGDDETFLRAAGEEALREIVELERLLSRFRSDSDIGRINSLAFSQPVRVDARTFWLLKRAKWLAAQTEGAFDITIGALSANEKEAAVGFENLLLDEDEMTVRLAKKGVKLDLGGIGKGYALERAGKLLREAGVENAFLHGGTSSAFAFGLAPNGEPWRVAISHPLTGETIVTVNLDNHGLSVSSTVPLEGRTIFDPQTGSPVQRTLLAAVILPSPTDAEAWSTALTVLGEEGLRLFQENHPSDWALVVDAYGSEVKQQAT